MKTLTLTCGLIVGVLAVGAGVAQAQTEERAKVSIPFSFEADGHSLPAGQYEVQIDPDNPDVVELQGIDHPAVHADMLTIPDDRNDGQGRQPALLFAKRNGVMELSKFVDPGWESRQMILARNER